MGLHKGGENNQGVSEQENKGRRESVRMRGNKGRTWLTKREIERGQK